MQDIRDAQMELEELDAKRRKLQVKLNQLYDKYNVQPRLQWFTGLPTQPGIYLYKVPKEGPRTHTDYYRLMYVTAKGLRKKSIDALTPSGFLTYSVSTPEQLSIWEKMLFAGPLTEPTDPDNEDEITGDLIQGRKITLNE